MLAARPAYDAGRRFTTVRLPTGAVVPTVATPTIVGGVLAFAIAATFTYLLFTGETDAQAVNGGWSSSPSAGGLPINSW